MMLEELRDSSVVLQIAHYEHRFSGTVEQFKADVYLTDGSRLHVNEVWLQGQLHKYAYYWLAPGGGIIQGWDNAPHHPHIATFPDHSHTRHGIEASTIRNLSDVLDALEQWLLQ